MSRAPCIISDLDGTLAIIGDRSPYDASRCDELDKPNKPVVECVKAMAMAGYEIVFVSAREEKDRAPTERFIRKHLPGLDWALFMRATKDHRPDEIVKVEIYRNRIEDLYDVLFVIDDRRKVVQKAWRQALGLTVFHCAEGDF